MDHNYTFRGSPLHYASALTLIAADWLIYAANIASLGAYFLAVDVAGALAALVAITLIESRAAHARPNLAAFKGLVGALIVAYPLPTLGTVFGALALAWLVFMRLRQRHAA